MQRGNGGRDDFFNFGDPFAGFGGLGGHGSLISNFFGGRDPFDDPFFTRPFGPSMFGPSMFGPGMFGPRGSIFGDSPASGFIEHEPPQANSLASGFIKHEPPQANKSKGPIIKELNSDDEEVEETEAKEKASEEKKDNPRKHSRSSKDPYVEEPDDEAEGRRSKHMQYMNDYNRADRTQPQARSFTFQSSTVTYGGADGPCYTSSKTRRTGSDGVMIEECKEADTTRSRAAHRLSRGLHDKGHSITRKLNSDGKVDTMQTLHNLNEDELVGFEDAWRGSARTHLPGWNERLNMHGDIGAISSGQGQATNGGWALPSTEQHKPQGSERRFGGGVRTGTSKGRARPSTRINID